MINKFFLVLLTLLLVFLIAEANTTNQAIPHQSICQSNHPTAYINSFYVPTKVTNYTWDASVPEWTFTDTTLYTLNDSGHVLVALQKDNLNNNIFRDTNVYDLQQHVLLHFQQNWNSGTWENLFLESSVYDTLGNISEHRYQQWTSGTWVTLSGTKYNYVYAGTQINESIIENWNGTSWENIDRHAYQYSATNKISEDLLQNWDGAAWVYEYKTDFTFGANDTVTAITYQNWDGTNWINDNQFINLSWNTWTGNPDSSEMTNSLQQFWNGTAWYDSVKYHAVYDSFHGFVGVSQVYDGISWNNNTYESHDKDSHMNSISDAYLSWNSISWYPTYSDEYLLNYDSHNNLSQIIFRDWDATGDTVQNSTKKVYEGYKLFSTEVVNLETRTSFVEVYPNPSDNLINIELGKTENNAGPFQLTVYDMNGRISFQSVFSSSHFEFETSSMASGLYLYSVSDKLGVLSKGKVVIP